MPRSPATESFAGALTLPLFVAWVTIELCELNLLIILDVVPKRCLRRLSLSAMASQSDRLIYQPIVIDDNSRQLLNLLHHADLTMTKALRTT